MGKLEWTITGTVSYLVVIVHAGQVSPALITSDFYQSLQRDIMLCKSPSLPTVKKVSGMLASFPGLYPFVVLFSLLNANRRIKNGGGMEQGYRKAMTFCDSLQRQAFKRKPWP